MNQKKAEEGIDDTLMALTKALNESEQFYRTAANNAISEELRELFRERADQRKAFAAELAAQSEAEPDEGGADPFEFLQRGLVTIKSAMTIERDKTDGIIIEESIEAEEELLANYEEALAQDPPAGLHDVLQRQIGQVKSAHAYCVTLFEEERYALVLGLFSEPRDAQRVVSELMAKGIEREHIHLVAEEPSLKEILEDERLDMAKEGAGAGAVGGTAVGGLIGLAIGVPMAFFVGPVFVLPVAAGVAAAGAAIGASYGGFFGALLGWGVGEDDVHAYLQGVRAGQILAAVQVQPPQAEAVVAILESNHGDMVAVRRTEVKQGEESV